MMIDRLEFGNLCEDALEALEEAVTGDRRRGWKCRMYDGGEESAGGLDVRRPSL